MRYFYAIALLLILKASGSQAQNLLTSGTSSHHTLVYHITNQEAEKLHKRIWRFDTTYLHTYYHSYSSDSAYRNHLPVGHYIAVRATGSTLRAELISVNPVSLKILNNHRDLAFVLLDSLGQSMPDLSASVRGKRIPYDTNLSVYRLPKSNQKGMITVTSGSHQSFFEIGRRSNNTWPLRVTRRVLNTFPVNHLVSPFFYIKNSVQNIVYGGWPNPPGIYYRVARLFQPRDRQHEGYVAFNKPIYKPGDTVYMKAYVTTLKGRPVNRALNLNLTGFSLAPVDKKLTRLTPKKKGVYTFDFVLHDSLMLRLDQRYNLQLRGPREHTWLESSFLYEDYELKTNTFTARSEQPDPLHAPLLYLKGEDSNGMPLFDVQAEVSLLVKQPTTFYRPLTFLPDSLWHTTVTLEPIGETRVAIPDSILPDGAFTYNAIIAFSNASRERTVKTLSLEHDSRPFPARMELKNDSVFIRALDTLETGRTFFLARMRAEHETPQPIALPFGEKVDASIQSYVVIYRKEGQEKQHRFPLADESDGLEFRSQRTRDSLVIQATNPRQIPFWYYLFRDQKLVAQGYSTDLHLRHRASWRHTYSLSVQYLWAGQSKTVEYQLPYQTKNLTIRVAHPDRIYPGEKASFTVDVVDDRGVPVPNADLTAFAMTQKFAPSVPSVPSFAKPPHRRSIFNEFHPVEDVVDIHRSLNWSYFRQRLGLDSMAFYQFLYPRNGYAEFRLPAEHTEVAPYVMVNGNEAPVRVVYIDGRPVYFAASADQSPYSFRLDSGYHHLRLRLRDGEISVTGVHLRANEKLILSVDKMHLPSNATFEKMEGPLTPDELKRFERYFVYLPAGNPSPAYLKQGSRYHLIYRERGSSLIGPIDPGWLSFVPYEGRKYEFPFEPGYSYEFRGDLIRQRSIDMSSLIRANWNNFREQLRLHDHALTEGSIHAYWKQLREALPDRFLRLSDFEIDGRKRGAFTVHLAPRTGEPKVVANLLFDLERPDNLVLYSPEQNDIQLPESHYQLVLLLADGRYARVDSLAIKAHGRNHLELTRYTLHPADTFASTLRQLIRKSATSTQENMEKRRRELQRVRQMYYEESMSRYGFTNMVYGTITSTEDGSPLPGVNVVVKGTTVGTVTDLDGRYFLPVPPFATLVVSFIGLQTEEVEVGSRSVVDVSLALDVMQLQEVVVTGQGVARTSRALSFSTTTLQGRVAGVTISRNSGVLPSGIMLRGVSSLSAGEEPLVLLDGVPVQPGSFDQASITFAEVLKGEQAVVLYGSRAKGGVILLSTRPGMTHEKMLALARVPMQTFSLPDTSAGTTLRKRFSDYAFWQPNLTTDKNGRAQWEATFPDDITAWNVHVLGMASRKRTGQTSSVVRSYKPLLAQLALPTHLVEGDSAIGIGKITNYTREPLPLTRTLRTPSHAAHVDSLRVADSHIDSVRLHAASTDSLEVEYTIQTGNYRDGERRKIRVYPQGVRETTGLFVAMPRDTVFSLTVPADGQYRIYAQADLLDVLLDEVDWLVAYPYGCSEQLASRLMALLASKQIAAYRGKEFRHDAPLNKIIRQLKERQNKDGGWSWWPGGESETWITLHVARALGWAREQGLVVEADRDGWMRYLTGAVAQTEGAWQLEVLIYLATEGEKVDGEPFAQKALQSQQANTYTRLLAQRLLQVTGHDPDWVWIRTQRKKTLKRNLYWGEDQRNIFNNSVASTLLVYEMLAKVPSRGRERDAIRGYFLEQRQAHWRNTYESANLIRTLLPEMLTSGGANRKPALILGKDTVTTFPYSTDATTGAMSITKTGSSPIYFTLFRESWVRKPQPVDSAFRVRTYFADPSKALTAGKPVTLTVAVEVKSDAEYVMIEVPIPAGCSYEVKSRGYGSGEVYREYFHHKTNIYCKDLRVGHYEYTIRLLPRYSGVFQLNPALAECMYFPVLFGREGMKRVEIR